MHFAVRRPSTKSGARSASPGAGLLRAVADTSASSSCSRNLAGSPVAACSINRLGLDLHARRLRGLRSRCHPLFDGQSAAGRRGHATRGRHVALGIVVSGIRPPGRLEAATSCGSTIAPCRRPRLHERRDIRQLRELLSTPSTSWWSSTPALARAGRRVPMSILGPVDHDLASSTRHDAVTFHERLAARGIELIEVPDAEFDSMAPASRPRAVVMVEGNRARAVSRACRRGGPRETPGRGISLKGGSGPTSRARLRQVRASLQEHAPGTRPPGAAPDAPCTLVPDS